MKKMALPRNWRETKVWPTIARSWVLVGRGVATLPDAGQPGCDGPPLLHEGRVDGRRQLESRALFLNLFFPLCSRLNIYILYSTRSASSQVPSWLATILTSGAPTRCFFLSSFLLVADLLFLPQLVYYTVHVRLAQFSITSYISNSIWLNRPEYNV